MNDSDTSPEVINGYDAKAGIRTAMGVIASILIMGLPVGACELWRAGGDGKIALWGFVATAAALVLGWLSISGSLKE